MGELWGGGTASSGLEFPQNTAIQVPVCYDLLFTGVELIRFTLFLSYQSYSG